MTSAELVDARALEMYEKVIDFSGELALRTHDVEFSPTTISAWKHANLLIYHLDKALDEGRTPEQEMRESLQGFFGDQRDGEALLEPQALEHAQALRDYLTPEQSEKFLKRGLRILDVCDSWKDIKDPIEYARRARLIGQLQATMFLQIVDPEVRKQPNFRAFTFFFRHAGRLSTGIDAVADLKEDFEKGRVAVEPSIKNRLAIASDMMSDGVDGVRTIGVKDTSEFLLRAARQLIRVRKRHSEPA